MISPFTKKIATGLFLAVIYIALACAGLYLLYLSRSVLIYLMIALVLTIVGSPMVEKLTQRTKMPNWAATILVMGLFVGLVLGFIAMCIPLLISQGENLSLLDLNDIEHKINILYDQIAQYLAQHNIDITKVFKRDAFFNQIDFQFIPNFINSLISVVSEFGVGLASVLFISFFFLKDKFIFSQQFKGVLPEANRHNWIQAIRKSNQLLSRYFTGLILQLGVIFVIYLTVLLIFGIPNAFIIAFICAVLNIVPYIGPLIASVLAGILTMISHINLDFSTEILPTTLYVMIGFWVAQLIDNNLTGPIIFSNSVKSHPLEIFLVVLIAGNLSGIIAMIIAVPLYTTLKVVLKEFFPENKIIQLLTRSI